MFYFKKRDYKIVGNFPVNEKKYENKALNSLFFGINRDYLNPDSTILSAMGKEIIIEKFLNNMLLVSRTNYEIIVAVCGIALHYMPKNRHTAYLYHRFGLKVRFFGNTSSKTTGENYNFHFVLHLSFFIFWKNCKHSHPNYIIP